MCTTEFKKKLNEKEPKQTKQKKQLKFFNYKKT